MTAGIVVVAIGVSAAVGGLLHNRAKIDVANDLLRKQLAQHDGKLLVKDRKIVELDLGDAATAETIGFTRIWSRSKSCRSPTAKLPIII